MLPMLPILYAANALCCQFFMILYAAVMIAFMLPALVSVHHERLAIP